MDRRRVAWLTLALAAAACTSVPPPTSTPSPATPLPASSLTAAATFTVAPVGPTKSPSIVATVGPTPSSDEFPDTAFEMPVLSVAEVSTLLRDGALNGRFAAVGGYWFSSGWGGCPFITRVSLLENACGLGLLTGDESDDSSERLDPVIPPELANAAELEGTYEGSAVVLIVHAGDSRAWACAPRNRDVCGRALVVDRLHWRNGHVVNPPPEPTTERTYVTSAVAGPDTVHSLEPRLVGRLRETASVGRWLVGPVAHDGTRGGVVRAYSDFDSSLLAEVDMVLSDQFRPGRVVIYAINRTKDYVRFKIVNPLGNPQESVFASGLLTSSSTPVVLEPADYELRVWRSVDPDGDGAAENGACRVDFRVERESEWWFQALVSRGGDCVVAETAWMR